MTDVVAPVGWVQVHHITVKWCVVADRSPLSTRPRLVNFFTVSFVSGFNAEIWSSAGVLGWVQARWALERAGLKFRETKHVVLFHVFATACVGFSLSLSLHHQQFLFETNFFDHQFFSPTFSFSNSEFME